MMTQNDNTPADVPEIDVDLLNEFTHDLKTPLGSARNMIELAQMLGNINEKQQHYLDRAVDSIGRAETIIKEMLDLASLDKNILDLSEFDVSILLDAIFDLFEDVAQQKNITIHNLTPHNSTMITADYDKLQNLVMNLVSNSMKYNRDNGEIFLSATSNTDNTVTIQVRDTGIGIPEKAQKKIFNRFYRASHPQHMRIEGTGLGLAIVSRIVELHHGTIHLESAVDVGTTITITLPN